MIGEGMLIRISYLGTPDCGQLCINYHRLASSTIIFHIHVSGLMETISSHIPLHSESSDWQIPILSLSLETCNNHIKP